MSLDYDPALDVFVSRSGGYVLVVLVPAVEELDSDAGERLVALLGETFGAAREETGAEVSYLAIGGPIYAAADGVAAR